MMISIFVAIPFIEEFSKVWDATCTAAVKFNAVAKRADPISDSDEILAEITASSVVVVDFTGKNKNVLNQLEQAKNLQKPIISISQNPSDIPSEIQSFSVIMYNYTEKGFETLTDRLISKLCKHLEIADGANNEADSESEFHKSPEQIVEKTDSNSSRGSTAKKPKSPEAIRRINEERIRELRSKQNVAQKQDLSKTEKLAFLQQAVAEFNSGMKANVAQKKINFYTKAIELFESAGALNDKNLATAYYHRAIIFKNQEKFELAIADCTEAFKINPKHAKALNTRGSIYFILDKDESALEDFSAAIKIDANFSSAYSNRGNLYLKMQKLGLAIANFTKALDINPEDGISFNNRGNSYKRQEKYKLAVADFSSAIVIFEKNNEDKLVLSEAYNNRGLAYKRLGEAELAREDFVKSSELRK